MSAPPFKVKATYDYSSPHDDDLSFPNGQIITVTDEEDADWYYGEYLDSSGAKQQGLFPKNFVEKYEPETPPRPTRPMRPKKEPEQAPISESMDDRTTGVHDSVPEQNKTALAPTQSTKQVENTSAMAEEKKPVPSEPDPQPSIAASPPKVASKPPAPSVPKSTKPPAAEPSVTGSFRDRIAAFNKAAAPVAPIKPAGLGSSSGSGFIKKPFVAPPPSKNAYVPIPREPPPQKVYRREEDPSLAAPATNDREDTGSAIRSGPMVDSRETEPDDLPKPTSLKERIALLQKQQMEQAARHADAVHKKEKPKRPPKKRNESYEADAAGNGAEEPELERVDSGDTTRGLGIQTNDDDSQPRARSSTRRHRSKEPTQGAADQPRDIYSDGNEADQSGAGDTEDGGDLSTGKDDSDEKPRAMPMVPVQRAPHAHPSQHPMSNEGGHGGEEQAAEDADAAEEDEDEEEEEEIDPEVRRRMEIRERMAKMSGGMGMAGMFGGPPLGGLPGPRKQKASGGSAKEKSTLEAPMADTAPRAIPGMALPGMQRVQSPEYDASQSEAQNEDEEEHTPPPLPRDRRSQVIPDAQEDVTLSIGRKSEERALPARRQSQGSF